MTRRANTSNTNKARTHTSFLLALVAALATFPASPQSVRWEAAVDVSAVKIEIKHVTPLELATLQRQYVARDTDPHAALDNDHREGLAILFTNKADGSHRCEIYVASKGMRAAKLADVLAHEAAHCFGFTHE